MRFNRSASDSRQNWIMSDVPNIFAMPQTQWSDRTGGVDGGNGTTAYPIERLTERLLAFGAAAVAWGAVGLAASLIWLVTG